MIAPGFGDSSWGMTYSTNESQIVYSGVKSISANFQNFGGIQIYSSDAFQSIRNYTSLVFYVNGGTQGGQTLYVGLSSSPGVNPLPLSGYLTETNGLLPNVWTKIAVPISDFKISDNATVFSILFQDGLGNSVAQPICYLDQISLIGKRLVMHNKRYIPFR